MQLYLQCDAEGCDHKEFVDTITEEMIGKECPLCGSNLLTEEDFKMFEPLMQAKELMQGLGLVADENTPDDVETSTISVHCHKNTVMIKGEK